MRIFTQDHRAVGSASGVFDGPNFGIHRAQHIGGGVACIPVHHDCALVVQRSRRVVVTDPPRQRVVMCSVARFVAQRPHDDARMVLVALHHSPAALQDRLEVSAVVAQRKVECVAFDVGFVDDEHAEFVAKVEQYGIVG